VSTTLDHRFGADGLTLYGHLARPPMSGGPRPGIVLCHGYPSGHGSGPKSAHTYPQLAERLAADLDAVVLAFNFRGCRPSEGMFSLEGWLNDVKAAVGHVVGRPDVAGVAAVGFGTGGALCLCAAAADPRVAAVAALGAPADFDGWAAAPRRLLAQSRELGLLGGREEPESFDRWAEGLKAIRPVPCAEALAPRPLLVMHGSDDALAPPLDARAVADAHGAAELRIIHGAGHQLRHDPRAVAVLLGWLDRQRPEIRAGAPPPPAPLDA
jgi:putative redox protein